jgi:uncharacterized protein (DUF1778 family)
MASTARSRKARGRSAALAIRTERGRAAAVKSGPVSLRMDEETRSLIDRAASVVGQNRTDFMLSSARDRATEVLLNQTFFRLPTADWEAFVSALDDPPPPNAKLKALLARKAPWED